MVAKTSKQTYDQTRLQIKSVPIESLHLDPKNARRHSERNLEAIAGSLDAFGQVEPIVVQRGTGLIIGGNGRYTVMRQLGQTHVDIVEVDVDDEHAAALGLALNRTAELGAWDLEHLERVVADIHEFDLDAIGLSQAELAAILKTPTDTLPEEDKLPALDEDAVSEIGEVYELGPHRLICGDSTDADIVDLALLGETPHLMIFDPPYDLDYTKWSVPDGTNVVAVWGRGWGPIEFVHQKLDHSIFDTHSLIFAGNIRTNPNIVKPACTHDKALLAIRTRPEKIKTKRTTGLRDEVLVANKKWWRDASEAIDTELARTLGLRVTKDGQPYDIVRDVGVSMIAGRKNWGKTLLCMSCLLIYAPKGSLVYDPCAGGGTSLIAATRYDRRWVGIEYDPAGCDFIRRRWTRYARQKNLDPGPGQLE